MFDVICNGKFYENKRINIVDHIIIEVTSTANVVYDTNILGNSNSYYSASIITVEQVLTKDVIIEVQQDLARILAGNLRFKDAPLVREELNKRLGVK